jgi:hypothetical protein
MTGDRIVKLLRRVSFARLGFVVALLSCGVGGCGSPGGVNPDGGPDGGGGRGAVHGRLAVAAPSIGQQSSGLSMGQMFGEISQPMSLDQVSVDLLRRDQQQDMQTDNWPVAETALPDSSGVFAFEDVEAGDYALRLNQPEFADLAYRVDSTEFHLGGGQIVTLVLPLVTTITHNLMDPKTPWNQNGDNPPAAALDHATGEIVLTSNLGFAVIDPDRGKMDLLFSQNFFLGREKSQNDGQQAQERRVMALAPNTRIAWILYPDRLVRVDRSLFANPDASETFNLDELATRVAVGGKFKFRMLPKVENNSPKPWWTGEVFFSPDEKILYASTQNVGVMVFNLDRMEVVRVILGHVIGYNPGSNHIFFTNGDYGQYNGTDVLVVDASTFLEINSAPIRNVLGVAPVPESTDTVLIRSQRSTSDVEVPFVVVVDGSGIVVKDQRAREYLGLDYDPGLEPLRSI